MSPACLDCHEVGDWCDTCSFVELRRVWREKHDDEPPAYLWASARVWGGRHALKQVRRQRYVSWASVRAPKGWRPTVGDSL